MMTIAYRSHTWLHSRVVVYSIYSRAEIDWLRKELQARYLGRTHSRTQVNVTVAIANWEGIGRKASARDNRKELK
jgi:hypothetical protein